MKKLFLLVVMCCIVVSMEQEEEQAQQAVRSKRAGLGLLERLDKEVPQVCTDKPCGRGLELKKLCNDTIDKETFCIPCRYQYYKNEKGYMPCRPCSQCAPGQTVSRWCTTKRNTLCSGDYVQPKIMKGAFPSTKDKKNKVVVPSYIITVIVPIAIIALLLGGAIFIYVKIKLTGNEKVPDKQPLHICEEDEEEGEQHYTQAGPLPTKEAMYPATIHQQTSPKTLDPRNLQDRAQRGLTFSFQEMSSDRDNMMKPDKEDRQSKSSSQIYKSRSTSYLDMTQTSINFSPKAS